MIDFNKPIRFTIDKGTAHFIGKRVDGGFVIERAGFRTSLLTVDEEGREVGVFLGELMTVDEEGREVGVFLGEPIIENVPERITRWILMTPDTGYSSGEDAAMAAVRSGGGYTVVKVEFE